MQLDTAPRVPSSSQRIRGLDTLRFVAALWVAIGHGATFPVRYVAGIVLSGVTLPNSIDGIFFNGSAAVIFFFLISGFCIHHPNKAASRFNTLSFLVRRYVRIGIPLLTIMAAIHLAGGDIGHAVESVLWTVYCELVYYAMYPLLRLGMGKFGTGNLVAAALFAAFALSLFHTERLYFWEFGFNTWIIGLPAWLLGCLLAERTRIDPTLREVPRVALWRIGGLILSTGALLLEFHGPLRIGYPISLNLFAIYSYFWLKAELQRYAVVAPSRLLEWGGLWSYSLYLIHNMAIFALFRHRAAVDPVLFWLCQVATIFAASYLFYLVVERPSHILARYCAERLRQWHSLPV